MQMKNPAVAAALLWVYQSNGITVFRQVSALRTNVTVWIKSRFATYTKQVRINGHIEELNASDIAEYYKSYPLHLKIRERINAGGETVDWDALKVRHDCILKAYRDGTEQLPQDEHL